MTPKEKAIELVSKFYKAKDEDGFHSMNKYRAKQCAFIAVDEILKCGDLTSFSDKYHFLQEVKEEINGLSD